MWMICKYNPNKPSIIVSSCYARQCHPETCCCDDDEYFVQQEVETRNSLGMVCGYHYTNIATGTKQELEDFVNKGI